jgi:hypothetical protein
MGGKESLINGAGKTVGRKVPVLGISVGAAETAKQGWNAKSALARAANGNRSKQERIASIRAAIIYGRRAILKAASTVAAQIPVYGTAAALTLDGANALLNVAEGNPQQLEREATRGGERKKRSTEAFMRAMREQAAKERSSGNTEGYELRNGKSQFADGWNSRPSIRIGYPSLK